jgi:hypothetical protein
MSLREFVHLPSAVAAQLLLDRAPAKAWALRRALDELLDGGKVPRPVSGWAVQRAGTPASRASPAA